MKIDATYTTPDQSHAMMEPHASTAQWNGDKLTLWTSTQVVDRAKTDLAKTIGIAPAHIKDGRRNQAVIHHHISLLHQTQGAEGEQVRVARTGSDQINLTGRGRQAFTVEHAFIKVYIDDVGTALDLLARHRKCFFKLSLLNQFLELG